MHHRFELAVQSILARHPEYQAEAYALVCQAIGVASEQLRRDKGNAHLSAEELYMAFVAYALGEYGPLASFMLSHWGIHHSKDVGAIVYNLIEAGVLSRQKEDRQEQFDNLQDLHQLLEEPFTSISPS